MKKIISLLLVVSMIFTFAGCAADISTDGADKIEKADVQADKDISEDIIRSFVDIEKNSYGKEMIITEQSQINFNRNQPAEKMEYSLERDQLNKKNKIWNNPDKISYIYLIDHGTIMGYFVIKGKVSSVNSKLTATNQLVMFEDYHGGDTDRGFGVVESPALDGSYGTNGDGLFFFLTDGTYMEWNGKYLLSDRPVRLNKEPIMVYEVKDVKINK